MVLAKKVTQIFANSKKLLTFAPTFEENSTLLMYGPFVYRLGRKVFILERGVRLPHGLQIIKVKTTNLKISRNGKS